MPEQTNDPQLHQRANRQFGDVTVEPLGWHVGLALHPCLSEFNPPIAWKGVIVPNYVPARYQPLPRLLLPFIQRDIGCFPVVKQRLSHSDIRTFPASGWILMHWKSQFDCGFRLFNFSLHSQSRERDNCGHQHNCNEEQGDPRPRPGSTRHGPPTL